MVKLIHKELSREVLDTAFAVHRIVGPDLILLFFLIFFSPGNYIAQMFLYYWCTGGGKE